MGSIQSALRQITHTPLSLSAKYELIMADTKPSSQLLSEIQASDSKVLKDVTTVENPAAKHDMAMFGVAKFDKNKLKTVETVEKNVLPSADDIKEEKSH